MMEVEKRVRPGVSGIEPYVPGISDDELKRRFGLSRIVKLNANENALGPSPKALAAIQHELTSLHHYPEGTSELLRLAIAEFHGVSAEQVMVGNGSDDIIKLISETFLDIGDQIIMPFPSFSQYAFGAAVMRAETVFVPLRDDFTYDVEALLNAVSHRTKLLYICTPNNPTGTILSQQELDWLLHRLPEHVILILDLAYNDYSLAPNRARETEYVLAHPQVVVMHTFSKLYGLAGLRVGYGVANPAIWSYVNRVREPFNVNRVAQRAATAALTDAEHRKASQDHRTEANRYYETALHEMGVSYTPTEGNFILVRTGQAVATMKAMMEHGVMVRAGFGGVSDHVRITFGTEEENQLCIQALKATATANIV